MLYSALYLAAVALLVVTNGFFVASEFSLVALRRSRVATLADSGDRRAIILLELVDNLNSYISATQLGITMASLALGWLGEPAIARLLERLLHGMFSDALRHTIAFALAFTVITFLHIVMGELAPKTLALERAEAVALCIARPLRIFRRIFYWPICFLDWSGTRTVRLFGLHPVGEQAGVYTVDELRQIIDISQRSGTLEADEQQLLHRIFEFSDAEVCEAMVPRSAVAALSLTASFDEVRAAFAEYGYSRMPVYRGELDNIAGVVFRRDLEPYLGGLNSSLFDLESLLHPPRFIPESARLSTALKQMQSSRVHLAFVVNEYGGIEGIITLEDLLEEIVGEIDDEFDDVAPAQFIEEGGSYLIDGMLPVRELNHRLSLGIPEDEPYTTVAGFLQARAGRLMNAEEKIEFNGAVFTVESVDCRRIRRVRFTPADKLS